MGTSFILAGDNTDLNVVAITAAVPGMVLEVEANDGARVDVTAHVGFVIQEDLDVVAQTVLDKDE